MFTETLPSGRVRAGFRNPETGKRVTRTFDYLGQASAWATLAEDNALRAYAAGEELPALPEIPGAVGRAAAPLASVPELPSQPASGLTVSEHGKAWLKRQHQLTANGRDYYQTMLNAIAATTIGDRPVAELRRAEVQEWLAAQVAAGKPGPRTINARLSTLRAVCQDAFAEDLTDRDATYKVKKLTEDLPNKRALTDAEIARLTLAAAGSPADLAALMLALEAGLRWGEVTGLAVDAVSLEHGALHVRQVNRRKAGIVKGTKGGKARWVPVSPALAAVLAPVVEEAERERGSDGLLFVNREGRAWDHRNFTRLVWIPLRAAAQLNRGADKITFHELRHTYATRLRAGGVSVADIQKALGHADAKTTLGYTHLPEDTGHHLRLLAGLAG